MEREFDAIFYDLGGTLRLVERDADFEARARQRIAELCELSVRTVYRDWQYARAFLGAQLAA